ncbi:MAG: efflux RND transporter permease subunit [Bryobacteraceae bacterium]|nr:efflux RND transporter permease subunit [Bryobacteraceae bacterium]
MEAITGSSADVAVILTGPDLAALREMAAQVVDELRQVHGAVDTAIEQEGDQPQLRIQVNRREAARHGISISDVQDVIELAVGGRPAGTMFDRDRRFDIVVRYLPEARGTLTEIGNILVTAGDGGRIPLARLAHIKVASGPTIVARRENRRQISVRTNVRGRDKGSFVGEAQQRLKSALDLPPGYKVEWGGQFENLERARRRLAWIPPITGPRPPVVPRHRRPRPCLCRSKRMGLRLSRAPAADRHAARDPLRKRPPRKPPECLRSLRTPFSWNLLCRD